MSSMWSAISGRTPLRSPRSKSRFRPLCLKLLIIQSTVTCMFSVVNANLSLLFVVAGARCCMHPCHVANAGVRKLNRLECGRVSIPKMWRKTVWPYRC